MRILGISGSLRSGSHNSQLLREAARLLPDGVELELYDGLKAVPPYDEDDEPDRPAAVERLVDAVVRADAIVFATPEYNGSVPGHLKNAIDWLSRPLATNPLRNKPAVVVGASTGMFGATWAQAELRKVLAATGARVVDGELPLPRAHESFDERGRLLQDEHAQRRAPSPRRRGERFLPTSYDRLPRFPPGAPTICSWHESWSSIQIRPGGSSSRPS